MTMIKEVDEKTSDKFLGLSVFTPKFYIMVGNIGSGKSTYIKNSLSEATVISKDGIRYAFGGGNYIFNRSFNARRGYSRCNL